MQYVTATCLFCLGVDFGIHSLRRMVAVLPLHPGVVLTRLAPQANNRYDLAIKNALVAAGGTGFTYPACSAPTWTSTGTYVGGSTVSYQGFVCSSLFPYHDIHTSFYRYIYQVRA